MSITHYEGKIGVFDYDDKVFEIRNGLLRFVNSYTGPIDLPKGCTSCYSMFEKCKLYDCYLRDFDASDVTDMGYMFSQALLPKDFVLGDNFDTSKVINMSHMFYRCGLLSDHLLGDKFTIENVTTEGVYKLFGTCSMSKDFAFGKALKRMSETKAWFAFRDAHIDGKAIRGKKLDFDALYKAGLEIVADEESNQPWIYFSSYDMKYYNSAYEGVIDVDDEMWDLSKLFAHVTIKGGCRLGHVNVCDNMDMDRMFYNSFINEGFNLGDCFIVAGNVSYERLFEDCQTNGVPYVRCIRPVNVTELYKPLINSLIDSPYNAERIRNVAEALLWKRGHEHFKESKWQDNAIADQGEQFIYEQFMNNTKPVILLKDDAHLFLQVLLEWRRAWSKAMSDYCLSVVVSTMPTNLFSDCLCMSECWETLRNYVNQVFGGFKYLRHAMVTQSMLHCSPDKYEQVLRDACERLGVQDYPMHWYTSQDLSDVADFFDLHYRFMCTINPEVYVFRWKDDEPLRFIENIPFDALKNCKSSKELLGVILTWQHNSDVFAYRFKYLASGEAEEEEQEC